MNCSPPAHQAPPGTRLQGNRYKGMVVGDHGVFCPLRHSCTFGGVPCFDWSMGEMRHGVGVGHRHIPSQTLSAFPGDECDTIWPLSIFSWQSERFFLCRDFRSAKCSPDNLKPMFLLRFCNLVLLVSVGASRPPHEALLYSCTSVFEVLQSGIVIIFVRPVQRCRQAATMASEVFQSVSFCWCNQVTTRGIVVHFCTTSSFKVLQSSYYFVLQVSLEFMQSGIASFC